MALQATVYAFEVALSDVDRGVYESFDLKVARHPSETARFMLLRLFAYALSHADGIAFSKGGLSSADEPALSITDPTGVRTAWIDIGAPSAERLHRASKATDRVVIYTADAPALLRETTGRTIYKAAEIEVFVVDRALLDALEPKLEKRTKLEIVRSSDQLYVTVGGAVVEGPIERISLEAA